MKDNPEYHPGSENYSHGPLSGSGGTTWLATRVLTNGPGHQAPASNGAVVDAGAGIDPWSLAEAVVKRWYWLFFGGLAFAAAAAFGGRELWKTSHTASVQLIRNDPPAMSEVVRDRATSMQTLADLLRSPELVQRVSAAASPAIAPDGLRASSVITPERNKESLTIAVTADTPEGAADLANLYARESVNYTKELQVRELTSLNENLQGQLKQIDGLIREFDDRLRQPAPAPQIVTIEPGKAVPEPVVETPPAGGLSVIEQSMFTEQLRVAHQELATLLSQYTEESSQIKAQRRKIEYLESSFKESMAAAQQAATNRLARTAPAVERKPPVATVSPTNVVGPLLPDRDVMRTRVASLEAARLPLASRQSLLQSLVDHPPGQLQVLIPAQAQQAIKHGRSVKIGALIAFAAMLGVVTMAALVLLVEAMGRRLKTEDDLRRVTRLPVIATLGDLRRMTRARQEQWAFVTWMALERRLISDLDQGVVCGIISSSEGEGRSTWTHLLARAARQRGYRVMTISTQDWEEGEEAQSRARKRARSNGGSPERDDLNEAATVTANVLASPGDVVHQLIGPNAQVIVEIALPRWKWTPERRLQLEAALDHWRRIENVVILTTLPPASDPQSVLLAEEMTHLIWLADSGRADAASTRRQVETLRHNRCQLVGAVLNHAPSRPLKNLFPRWVAA